MDSDELPRNWVARHSICSGTFEDYGENFKVLILAMAATNTYIEEEEEDESMKNETPEDKFNQQAIIGGTTPNAARDPDSGEPLLRQETVQPDSYSHYELIQLNDHNDYVTDKDEDQTDSERNSSTKEEGKGEMKGSDDGSVRNTVQVTILTHQRNSNCGHLINKFLRYKILPCHGIRRMWGLAMFYVFLILIIMGKRISLIGQDEQELLKYEQVTKFTKSAYPTVTFCNQSPFNGEKLEEYYLNQITDAIQEVDPQLEFLMILRLLNTMLQLASQNRSSCELFENFEKDFWGGLQHTPDSNEAVENINQARSSKRKNRHKIKKVSEWITDNYENTKQTIKYPKDASKKYNTKASSNATTHGNMSKSTNVKEAMENEKNIRKYELADLEDSKISHSSKKAHEMIQHLTVNSKNVKNIDGSDASSYNLHLIDAHVSPDHRKKREAEQGYEYTALAELFYEIMLKPWNWTTEFIHAENDEDLFLVFSSLSALSLFSLERIHEDLNGSSAKSNQSLFNMQEGTLSFVDTILPVTLELISILEANFLTYVEDLPSDNYEALEYLKILNDFPYLNFQGSLLEDLDNLPLFDYYEDSDYVWMKNAEELYYADLNYQIIIEAFPFLSWYFAYTYASTLDTWNFFFEQEYLDNVTIGNIELFTKYFIPPNSYSNWKWGELNQYDDNTSLDTLHENETVRRKQDSESIFTGAGVDSLEANRRTKRSPSTLDINDIESLLHELIESRGITASQLLNILDLSISRNRRLLINDKQLRHYGFNLQDMLLQCQQQTIPCTEEDFESWTHSYFGTCFTLNSSKVEQVEDKQSSLGSVPSGISLTLGSEVSSSLGYIVSVHHPEVKPDMWTDGIVVRPSQNVKLMLNEKRYEKSDEDKREYTGLSTHSCHDLCYNEVVKERCGCSQLHEPTSERVQSTRCNSTHWDCLLKLLTLHTNASCSACKPSYHDSFYEVEVSSVEQQHVYRSCRSDDNINNIRNRGIETRIYINFKSNYAESYTTVPAKSMLALITDVVVLLYLFTGASVLTVIQVIEFIIQLFLGAEKEAVYKSTTKKVAITGMRKTAKENEGATASSMLSSTSV